MLLGLRTVVYPVTDLDAAKAWYASLVAPGAAPLDPVQGAGGGIKVCRVRDPFGNRLGFIENPQFDPRKVRQVATTADDHDGVSVVGVRGKAESSSFGGPLAVRIRRIVEPEPAALDGLTALLVDVVHGGASVGFLAPLADATATNYWRRVLGQLQDGLALWVAEDGARIVGSVQLEFCAKENGRHRAEVQKLFVLTSHRGLGISTRLMKAVEECARANGRSLLVLDTLSDSAAASVYRHLGWQYAGSIPDYAATPDGALCATSYFYKQLG